MNLWRLLIFMICLSGTAQANDVTYVRVTAGVPVQDEVVKNFNIVHAVEGDGFLQMIAVFNQTEQLWRTRLIRTDTFGAVLWSKDYTFYEGPAYEVPISNVPFSICESISGNGYVISGIWSAHGDRLMEHGSIQSPFYFEVGDTGQVVHLSLQQAYYVAKPNIYGFAPLKIKPVGTQGYVAVGVMSDSLSEITSTNRFGRICLLNDTFEETQAKLVRSEYAVTSNIRSYSGTTFDAFNNVEVVEVPGQQYSFVVTGSVTGDLACPSNPSDSGKYGNAQAYLARFDDTLGIVWEHLGLNSPGGADHSVFSDIYVDTQANEVYFVSYGLIANRHHRYTVVGKLDFVMGTQIDSYIIRVNLPSSTYLYFYNQIEKVADTLWLTGYTYNDEVQPHGNPPNANDELNPIVLKLALPSYTILEDYMLNSNSIYYLTTYQNCYLCYRRIGKDFLYSVECKATEFDTSTTGIVRTPAIYAPTHTLFYINGTHILAGPYQDSILILSYPMLYGIQGDNCEHNDDEKIIIPGPYFLEGQTQVEPTVSEQILDYILFEPIEFETEECP